MTDEKSQKDVAEQAVQEFRESGQATEQEQAQQEADVGEKHSISGGEPQAKRPRRDNNDDNNNGGGIV